MTITAFLQSLGSDCPLMTSYGLQSPQRVLTVIVMGILKALPQEARTGVSELKNPLQWSKFDNKIIICLTVSTINIKMVFK